MAGKVVKPKKELTKKLAKAVTNLATAPTCETLVKPTPKNPAKFAPDATGRRYWLIKSEPESRIDPRSNKDVSFPLSKLLEVAAEPWDGVRNHEAKNNMLNMRVNDLCLFYHSNCSNPGIVGMAKVVHEAHPDEAQFDSESNYYDGKATSDAPRWWCVDVAFHRRFRKKVSLVEIKKNDKLSEFMLVKRGRLSVIPVSEEELEEVFRMEKDGDVCDDIDCDVSKELIEEKR